MSVVDVKDVAKDLSAVVKTHWRTALFGPTDVPDLVVFCVRYLSVFHGMPGHVKKQIVVQTLQILCPNDEIDKVIPAMVDTFWEFVKADIERGEAGCLAWLCCLRSKKKKKV